ncbi:MAG: FCD domain-containing protein, partial [Lachnospiraceae bacterium]
RDVLEVRRALEELAVRIACEKITDEEIEQLKITAQNLQNTLDSKDVTKIAEADVQFHDIIYFATDNQRLIQLLNNLAEQMYRYRVEYLKRENFYENVVEEHKELIRTIEAKQQDMAAQVMCRHIDNQVEAVIHTIRSKQI